MFSQVIRSFTSQFPAYVLHVRWETGSQCAQRSESLLFPSIFAPRFPRVAPAAAIQTRAGHLLFLFFYFFPSTVAPSFSFSPVRQLPARPPPPPQKKKLEIKRTQKAAFCAYVPFVNDSRALSNDAVAPPTFLTVMT